jgi:hypothetical protein
MIDKRISNIVGLGVGDGNRCENGNRAGRER